MFTSPGEIAFSINNFGIHWYGIIMSISIIFGIAIIMQIRKSFYTEITKNTIYDISFWLIIYGVIFARLYYVIMDYHYFIKHPLEIIAIWNGGISIQGAIIGGIIATIIYSKRKSVSFFKFADLLSFGIISGQIIGRWGNFFNSEAFGLPSNLPWKLYIPIYSRPLEYRAYEYFHPTFLYESLLNVLILFILLLILKFWKNRKDGYIFFTYLLLYSIIRLFVETIRIDSVLTINNIHIAHITSIIFIMISLGGYYYLKVKKSSQTF